VTFAELKSRCAWRPIPGCPGRFVLASGPSRLAPDALVPDGVDVSEHTVAAATDPVIIASLDEGGLISYRKPDGRFVHTLNSREGFERKLRQLGIR
jgi:hypothetical protein